MILHLPLDPAFGPSTCGKILSVVEWDFEEPANLLAVFFAKHVSIPIIWSSWWLFE
jgi:hypothetical protein